jgi:hypothetical protein
MSRVGVVVLAAVVGATPLRAQEINPDLEIAALRSVAASIPLGSRVRVQTVDGRRYAATLLAVDETSVVLKRITRVPEPAVRVAFERVARLERDQANGGWSVGKAIALGLSAGAGAVLSLIAFAIIVSD